MSSELPEEFDYASRDPVTWHAQKHDPDNFCKRMKTCFAEQGDLENLMWMHMNCDAEHTTEALDGAATNGHLEVVKWLHEAPPTGCTSMRTSTSSFADMTQLWNWCSGAKCTTAAMDGAAMNGHLNVVKWLHKNRSEGGTTSAMDGAASNGHFEVVMWLHCNRGEGCTTEAIDGAASNGFLLVVDWLHKNRVEGCTEAAMINAASKGFMEVVKYLHTNLNQQATNSAIIAAANNGNLSVVQYLHENHSELCTADAIAHANKNGHVAIVDFLLEHEGCRRAYDEDRFIVDDGENIRLDANKSQEVPKAELPCEDVAGQAELEARLRAEEEAKIRVEEEPRIRAEVEAAIRVEQEEALMRARIRAEIQAEVEEKMRAEIRAELLTKKKSEPCAICFMEIDDPLTAACDHTFCSGCLMKWRMRGNELCPMCRSSLN